MIEPESEDESGEDVEDENENDDDDYEGADSDRVSVASGISREQHSRLSIDTPGSPYISNYSAIRRSSSQNSIRSTRSRDTEYDEEDERKTRLQIYVFISRCIAYPFNAKQPTDLARRQTKVTKQNLIAIKERFASFLYGKTNIIADEAFKTAVKSYHESFICSDRVAKMVTSGGYSVNDFREVFKANIEKKVRNLPEIEGLSKETVLSSWMAKFDAIYRGDEDQKRTPARLAATAASELYLSKDQLYLMFQTILGVKKYEHVILFNACQLDSADEQAACIRRELQSRKKALEDAVRDPKKDMIPKFIIKDMENIYLEEQKAMINQLMVNLEQFPVYKSGSDVKSTLYKMKKAQNTALTMMDVQEDSEALTEKLNAQVFALQVIVSEARGLSENLPPNRIIFVVMELEGGEKWQTDQAEASRPVWENHGDWSINQPLPVVRLRLLAEDNSLFALDHKELGKCTLTPHCGMPGGAEWYKLTSSKAFGSEVIELKVSVKFEKPQNVKKCGFLFAKGQNKWKKWKKRFFMLFQVSQYNFTLCSYRLRKGHPTDKMAMQGYTVDYSDAIQDEELQGARFFFRAEKEGDLVVFASTEDAERHYWVNKLYNATGQSFKPAAPKIDVTAVSTDNLSRAKDADRARKHGLDDVIQADPVGFEHFKLFESLQRMTLLHRLNDSYTCLGWFSPGQLFVLDEYCARYGVRGCHRHLCYLADLLERAENGVMIDPTLLHYSYAFCAAHVLGNKPDGVNTVTLEERDRFEVIKERLKDFLSNQITQFRYCFPFGRPEGAFKSSLLLFERVLTKDNKSPANPDDVRSLVRNCLRKAALVNYTRLSAYAKIEETSGPDVEPKERLDKVMQLAELCIELIQQNEEHHAEALTWYTELMVEHTEIFWSLYAVDMDEALVYQPIDTWDSFVLFQMLNNYLRMERSLCGGKFHCHLRDKFAPLVVRYIDMMESSIAKSLDKTFNKETWTEVGFGCASSEEVFWKLQSIQSFIRDLHWPDEEFANHLNLRLKLMASDMIEAVTKRVLSAAALILKDAKVDYKYIIPREICVMLNVFASARAQSEYLCTDEKTILDEYRYHSSVGDVLDKAEASLCQDIANKLSVVLERILKKLARFDHGKITSVVFSVVKSNDTMTDRFIEFILSNLGIFRMYVKEMRLLIYVSKAVWDSHCQLWCDWLIKRQDVALDERQFNVLWSSVETCRSLFENQGLTEQALETEQFKAAYDKLMIEKTLFNLKEPSELEDPDGYGSQQRLDHDLQNEIGAL